MKEQNLDISMLLEQCKQNNQKAMFSVYHLYCKAMFNVAYRIIGNTEIAEDVTQDSFLDAFAKLEQYKGIVTFGAWLKKIVVHKSITELQKTKKIHFTPLEDTLKFTPESETEDWVITTEKVHTILQALEHLKPNYKILFTLYYIEGYDTEEISSILGIAEGNCRTTLSRAKESLKNKLGIA